VTLPRVVEALAGGLGLVDEDMAVSSLIICFLFVEDSPLTF
jgi:hypothetical protein